MLKKRLSEDYEPAHTSIRTKTPFDIPILRISSIAIPTILTKSFVEELHTEKIVNTTINIFNLILNNLLICNKRFVCTYHNMKIMISLKVKKNQIVFFFHSRKNETIHSPLISSFLKKIRRYIWVVFTSIENSWEYIPYFRE